MSPQSDTDMIEDMPVPASVPAPVRANDSPPASTPALAAAAPMQAQRINGATHQLFLPVLWLALSVLGWLGFMTTQLWFEREQLLGARQSQETNMAAAARIRAALDAVATQTARLADAGNSGAQVVVGELRKNGITINSTSAQPAK